MSNLKLWLRVWSYIMLCMLACLFSAMLMVCNSINLLVNPYPNADPIGIYRKGEFSAPS